MAAPADDRYYRLLRTYLVSRHANAAGEWRMRCPLHDDSNPSASVNFDKSVFHCSVCGGTSLATLERRMKEDLDDDEGFASYNPFIDSDEVEVVDLGAYRQQKEAKRRGRAPLTEAKVVGQHEALMAEHKVLDTFMAKRGLTLETIQTFKLGYERDSKRITIPVYDEAGTLVNVRRYKMDASAGKMWNAEGWGTPPRLYPVGQLNGVVDADHILVVEGELDALIAIQHGFPAVTGTGGAQKWEPKWGRKFTGKHVTISYDNDDNGARGARKAARSISPHALTVRIAPPLCEEPKSDITDFFLRGGTADQLRALLDQSEVRKKDEPPPEPVECKVIGTMDSTTNGRPLVMSATVVGKKGPTYSVPARAQVSCTMAAGAKCSSCIMLENDGEMEAILDRKDAASIARFIDATEDKRVDLVRKHLGAVRCTYFTVDEYTEQHSVEELTVMGSIDLSSDEEADYTQRRVYNVGQFETPMNTPCRVAGTTWPSPKDGRNEFYAWDLDQSITSIDAFHMTPKLLEQLRIFQPEPGQTPIEKCIHIAQDLSANVTDIAGRERLHVAMDLVWHSILSFNFNGRRLERGWLEFIVVGDTRTGKSETAKWLSRHYGLGHIIGCESASFAGLVGGVKQTNNSWSITWGEIPINDRRLVVLDEASGLHQEIIRNMSDIRSRGIAQLTKVESAQVPARCRMIWISNAVKGKFVDEKRTDGIDILEDLIGNPEDIARFDFAMSVRATDVPDDKINVFHISKVPHIYTSELCHQLVLWCWSRRPEHVIIDDETSKVVYEMARRLGRAYVGDPPLIQSQNVREKLLRASVGLAARTFSTEDGEHVLVQPDHVQGAAEFIHKLYSYDNFGYFRYSKRVRRNRDLARKSKAKAFEWLKQRRRLVEFLLDRRGSSFRSNDLEEMAGMEREEVMEVINYLSACKMIGKEKSQIVLEPELQDLLKEFE